MRPQPWHAKAREMHADGASYRAIAVACDAPHVSVMRFLDPDYRRRQTDRRTARRRERLAAEPEYRRRTQALKRKSSRLCRLRQAAKCEAYDTGRRYEDVCAAWDITP